MSTRKTLIAAAARELGWRTGSISSGTSLSVVLDGYTLGDDEALRGATLCMPDAATEADRERTIEHWDDSARTAHWVTARADTTYTNETYIIIPQGDLTRHDLNTALNDVLAEVRYTVHSVLPTVQDERLYRLGRFSWIRYADDIDGVFLRNSPNLLSNSNFDVWGEGQAAQPTSWGLFPTLSASVARSASEARGYYSATVTRGGSDATLVQVLGLLNGQLRGETVTLSGWARASVASRVRLQISDGLTTTSGSYHTGGGGDELLTVTKTLSAVATDLQFICSVDTGDTTGEFSGVVAVEGDSVPDALTDTGDSSYQMRDVVHRVRQLGDQVAIELEQSLGRGQQLVIASAQPYPAISSDSTSTDAPDSVVIHGLVDQVVSRMAKGQLRDRLEALRVRHHNQFIRLSTRRRERPVVEMQPRYVVRGA